MIARMHPTVEFESQSTRFEMRRVPLAACLPVRSARAAKSCARYPISRPASRKLRAIAPQPNPAAPVPCVHRCKAGALSPFSSPLSTFSPNGRRVPLAACLPVRSAGAARNCTLNPRAHVPTRHHCEKLRLLAPKTEAETVIHRPNHTTRPIIPPVQAPSQPQMPPYRPPAIHPTIIEPRTFPNPFASANL